MQYSTIDLNRRLQGRLPETKMLSCGPLSYDFPGRVTKMICRRLAKMGLTEPYDFGWWAMELYSGEIWVSSDGCNWMPVNWTEE